MAAINSIRQLKLMLFRFFLIIGSLSFIACTLEVKPQLVIYGKDVCEHCHMVISDPRFGAQLQTSKGKTYLFDSVNCLDEYLRGHSHTNTHTFFVDSFHKDQWLSKEEALFKVVPLLRSPMGVGVFSARDENDFLKLNLSAGSTQKSKTPAEGGRATMTIQGAMKWEELSIELAAGKLK